MAFTVTEIDFNTTTTSSGTVSVTVPAGGVSSGSLIICLGEEDISNNIGTVTDSASNTYKKINSKTAAGSAVTTAMFFAQNCTALSSGQTITLTLSSSTHTGGMNCFYVQGAATSNANDPSTNNSATGSSSNPSVTSGTMSEQNELFIGYLYFGSVTAHWTQDSVNGAWAAPPNDTGGSNFIVGGNLVKSSVGTQKYNPTISAVKTFTISIAGFRQAIMPVFNMDSNEVQIVRKNPTIIGY